MKTAPIFLILIPLLLKPDPGPSPSEDDDDVIFAGDFFSLDPDEATLPENWETMNFTGIPRTEYRLVKIDGKSVIKAVSDGSSSGLVREMIVDPEEFPVLRWSWKAENIIKKGDVHTKSGDDYPARIYVMFDYDIKNLSWGMRQRVRALRTVYGRIPTRAINYVWDTSAEPGTVVKNAHTRLVKMKVVESGDVRLGEWITYERNIYDDYVEIFGEKPPKIAAVAIMTDSDDTGESAVAYYGNISFHRE